MPLTPASWVVSFSLLLLGTSTAVAQDTHAPAAPGSDAAAQSAADSEARSLHQAAVAAYEAGRYETAMERFRESYALSGRTDLLYNVGQSADRARLDLEAVEAFEAFLERGEMDDSLRRTVEGRVAFLRARLAGESSDAPDAPATTPGDDGGSLASSGWFWAVVVGAAALVAGGVVLAVVLSNDSGSYTSSDLGRTLFTLEFGP